jgi:hypothetical protein
LTGLAAAAKLCLLAGRPAARHGDTIESGNSRRNHDQVFQRIVVGLGALLFAAADRLPIRSGRSRWSCRGRREAAPTAPHASSGRCSRKELGQPVNVVNRVGGSGVVGHSAIAQAAPDGYTIGIITVEIGMMHWQGLTDLTGRLVHADRARQRGSGGRAGRRRFSVQERQRARRSHQGESGKFKASGTGQGGIWHLANRGMLQDLKVDPRACRGCRPAAPRRVLLDLVAGGVQIAPCRCRKRAR